MNVEEVEEEDDDVEREGVEEENRSGDQEAHFVRARAVETHMEMSQEPFCMEIYRKKCRTPIPGTAFCASQRSRNAHGHVTRAMFMKIYKENGGCSGDHLDLTPGLNCYRKNPSVWPRCLGKKNHYT